MPNLENLEGETLLEGMIKEWDKFTLFVYHMRRVFYYLDRYYVDYLPIKVSLATTALQVFREKCSNLIYEKLYQATMAHIDHVIKAEGHMSLGMTKRYIQTLSEMGATYPDIVKQGDLYLWKNDERELKQMEKIALVNKDSVFNYQKWTLFLSYPEYFLISEMPKQEAPPVGAADEMSDNYQ